MSTLQSKTVAGPFLRIQNSGAHPSRSNVSHLLLRAVIVFLSLVHFAEASTFEVSYKAIASNAADYNVSIDWITGVSSVLSIHHATRIDLANIGTSVTEFCALLTKMLPNCNQKYYTYHKTLNAVTRDTINLLADISNEQLSNVKGLKLKFNIQTTLAARSFILFSQQVLLEFALIYPKLLIFALDKSKQKVKGLINGWIVSLVRNQFISGSNHSERESKCIRAIHSLMFAYEVMATTDPGEREAVFSLAGNKSLEKLHSTDLKQSIQEIMNNTYTAELKQPLEQEHELLTIFSYNLALSFFERYPVHMFDSLHNISLQNSLGMQFIVESIIHCVLFPNLWSDIRKQIVQTSVLGLNINSVLSKTKQNSTDPSGKPKLLVINPNAGDFAKSDEYKSLKVFVDTLYNNNNRISPQLAMNQFHSYCIDKNECQTIIVSLQFHELPGINTAPAFMLNACGSTCPVYLFAYAPSPIHYDATTCNTLVTSVTNSME